MITYYITYITYNNDTNNKYNVLFECLQTKTKPLWNRHLVADKSIAVLIVDAVCVHCILFAENVKGINKRSGGGGVKYSCDP